MVVTVSRRNIHSVLGILRHYGTYVRINSRNSATVNCPPSDKLAVGYNQRVLGARASLNRVGGKQGALGVELDSGFSERGV